MHFLNVHPRDVSRGTISLPDPWASLTWRMEAIFDTFGLWPDEAGWMSGQSILLPPSLARARTIVVVGVMDHLELFDAERWRRLSGEKA